MLGTTFPAVFGRRFTSLMSRLTAVVAQVLFLYHFFTVNDCYDFHAFKGICDSPDCSTHILSDCSWTRIHNHLVHKETLNHLAKLAKWLSVPL